MIKKVLIKLTSIVLIILILVTNIPMLIQAAPSDYQVLNSSGYINGQMKYVYSDGTVSNATLPSFPNLRIKAIWGNFIRNGQITPATTDLYFVMNSGVIGIPANNNGQETPNQFYLNLYSTNNFIGANGVETGTTNQTNNQPYSNVPPFNLNGISSQFLQASNISQSLFLSSGSLSGVAAFVFRDNNFFHVLSEKKNANGTGSFIVNNNPVYFGSKAQYNKGNSYGIQGQLLPSVIQLAPTVNAVTAGDNTLTGTGTQVGDTIKINLPNGTTATTTVDNNKNWTYTIPNGAQNGATYSVIESDVYADPSITATTVTKSKALSLTTTGLLAGATRLGGTGTPGARIQITGATNKGTIVNYGGGVVNSDGSWAVLPGVDANNNVVTAIAGTTYTITESDNFNNTMSAKVTAFDMTGIGAMNFGTPININQLKTVNNNIIKLQSWSGIQFGGDLTTVQPINNSGTTNNPVAGGWNITATASPFTYQVNGRTPVQAKYAPTLKYQGANGNSVVLNNSNPVTLFSNNTKDLSYQGTKLGGNPTIVNFANNATLLMDLTSFNSIYNIVPNAIYATSVNFTLTNVPK